MSEEEISKKEKNYFQNETKGDGVGVPFLFHRLITKTTASTRIQNIFLNTTAGRVVNVMVLYRSVAKSYS